jgi:mevalonate kinase
VGSVSWSSFHTRASGKWVLAGEHSVLRGATAVALPHASLGLNLRFEPGDRLRVEPSEAEPLILELVGSIADAQEESGKSFIKPQGVLKIESDIPIGAGLGSSAALCVALTRWMASPLGIAPEQQMEFATQLEHRFHGRSSGMDVAAIISGEPIAYLVGRGIRSLGVRKLPHFTFHDTGIRTRTSECILRVEKFREEAPALGVRVDDSMGAASRIAVEGLVKYDSGHSAEGLELLKKSMQQAQECFYSWELVPGAAKRLEEDLFKQGALAVKMTGAGGGGMLVALWENGKIQV